jgi:glycosyltransferase involved in cell wall biosynthesis
MANGAEWPRVSVVTPSFNQGDYLEETIRSVLLQGYPNLEYIVIDGGSTDQSVEIIRKYEPWLTYWVSEADGGQANAINKGWRIATGDAVTWLNSDDTLQPGALAAAVCALYAAPDIDLVHGRANFIDASSHPVGVINRSAFVPEEIIVQARTPFPQPGFLMKQRLLERFGWLDESMHFCMDLDYWTRLAIGGVRARYVEMILANFRTHESSKSNTLYRRKIAERIQVHEKAFASPQLGAKYLSQRARARSYTELAAGRIAYMHIGDAKLTRKHLWRHILAAKWRLSWRGLLLLVASLGGERGLSAASEANMWFKKPSSLMRGQNTFD